MPRWDDPSIIGQPEHGAELPPNDWQGWRPESFRPPRVRLNGSEALVASMHRHPAFEGLDHEYRAVVIDSALRSR